MTQPGGLRLLMTADTVGGVWTYALDLAAGLAVRGVATLLAVLGPAPDGAQRAAAHRVPGLRLVETGLPLEWLAADAAAAERSGEVLARMAAEAGVDLVQLNAPGPAAATAFPVPVVVMCHSCVATWWRTLRSGPMPEEFLWRANLAERGYRQATALVAPSAGFAAMTQACYRLTAPLQVVHNARRAPPAARTRALPRVAFTAGRLWDEGKDIATLDRAARLLPFPVEAAGPVEAPHGARASLPHLRLLGPLPAEDVARRLAARPVFVSAARYEPFGLAVLEAAQAGCALVLADTPVFRELWDGAAVFVPPGDEQGFATALLRLVEDRERREERGVAAQERARHYDPDRQADTMLALYHRLRADVAQRRTVVA